MRARIRTLLPDSVKFTPEEYDDFWMRLAEDYEKCLDPLNPEEIRFITKTVFSRCPFFRKPRNESRKRIFEILMKLSFYDPIYNYSIQLDVISLMVTLVPKYISERFIEVDWHIVYNFVDKVFGHDYMLEISNNTEPLTKIFQHIWEIAHFFPDEADEEIYEFFMPKIISGGNPRDMLMFSLLYPTNAKNYKKVVPIFTHYLRETDITALRHYLTNSLTNFVLYHFHDDNSDLLDVIFEQILLHVVWNVEPIYMSCVTLDIEISHNANWDYDVLAQALCCLFYSPPSREITVKRIQAFLVGLKDFVHPSNTDQYDTSPLQTLIFAIVSCLHRTDILLAEKKLGLPADIRPSQQEYESIFEPLVSTIIYTLQNVDSKSNFFKFISKVYNLCPSLMPRLYNFAIEIISYNDTLSSTLNAWVILTASLQVKQFEPDFIENQMNFVRLAIENFYMTEQQNILIMYLTIFFSIAPLSKKTNYPSNIDIEELGESFLTSIISSTTYEPTAVSELYRIAFHDHPILSLIYCVFSGADKSVLHSFVPILSDMITNPMFMHVPAKLLNILQCYGLFADSSDVRELYNLAVRESSKNIVNIAEIRFLAFTIATLGREISSTADEMRNVIKDLAKYRNSEERKTKRIGWNATSAALIPFGNYIMKVEPNNEEIKENGEKTIGDVLIPFKNMVGSPEKATPFFTEVVDELYVPYIEEIMKLEDVNQVISKMKPFYKACYLILQKMECYTSEDYSLFPKSFIDTPKMLRKPVKNLKLSHAALDLSFHLNKKFHDNQIISTEVSNILLSSCGYLGSDYNYFSVFHTLGLDDSAKMNGNRFIVSQLLTIQYNKRLNSALKPLCKSINYLLDQVLQICLDKNVTIAGTGISVIQLLHQSVQPLAVKALAKLFKADIPISDEFIFLYSYLSTPSPEVWMQPKLLKMLEPLTDLKKDESENNLKVRLMEDALDYDWTQIKGSEEQKSWEEFTLKLAKAIEDNNREESSFQLIAAAEILTVLKHVDDVPESIFNFILKTACGEALRAVVVAITCIIIILQRKSPQKENIKTFDGKLKPLDELCKFVIKDMKGNSPEDFLPAADEAFEIENVCLYDNPSTGFYTTPKKYNDCIKTEFHKNDKLLAAIPEITRAIFNLDATEAQGSIVFQLFGFLASCMGPVILDPISELIEEEIDTIEDPEYWAFLVQIISDMVEGVKCWPVKDCHEFTRKIVMPILIKSLNNPQFFDEFMSFPSAMYVLHPCRFSPFINYLLAAASADPNEPSFRRRALTCLMSISTRALSYVPIFQTLFDRFIKPLLISYKESQTDLFGVVFNSICDFINIFLMPASSPYYDPKFPQMINGVVEFLDGLIKGVAGNSKKTEKLLENLWDQASRITPAVLTSIFPIFEDNVPKLLRLISTSNHDQSMSMISSLHDVTQSAAFAMNNDRFVKFLVNIFSNILTMSTLTQRKILNSTRAFLRFTTFATKPEALIYARDKLKEIFFKVSNPIIQVSILTTYGVLLRATNSEPVDINDRCAYVITAHLLDQREKVTEDSLEEIEKALMSCSDGEQIMFRRVIEFFWSKHEEQISPSVLEALDRYRTLAPPSYIS